jgi:hypothetical protein
MQNKNRKNRVWTDCGDQSAPKPSIGLIAACWRYLDTQDREGLYMAYLTKRRARTSGWDSPARPMTPAEFWTMSAIESGSDKTFDL